jgi:hypothetical protein
MLIIQPHLVMLRLRLKETFILIFRRRFTARAIFFDDTFDFDGDGNKKETMIMANERGYQPRIPRSLALADLI